MKNKFELKETVESLTNKQTGIVISYSKVLFSDEYVYSVFFPSTKEYLENIWEGDLISEESNYNAKQLVTESTNSVKQIKTVKNYATS